MSFRGSINVQVTVKPGYDREVAEFTWGIWDKISAESAEETVIEATLENADYLDKELVWLAGELFDLAVKPDEWRANIVYESADGEITRICIENGVISSWEESEITFVEVEPRYKFELSARMAD